jgi:hypothetical protein
LRTADELSEFNRILLSKTQRKDQQQQEKCLTKMMQKVRKGDMKSVGKNNQETESQAEHEQDKSSGESLLE